MFKCLPFQGGVDVSVNTTSFFTFKPATHLVSNLGNNNVRISRKIDNLVEILEAPISDFVDLTGSPVASNYQGLYTYFNKDRIVQAGEGVAVVDGVVSLVAGGPSTLGGFKVGTGLVVDGSGRLSASASSEITKVLNTEAEMLALPVEELRSYRVIRLDTKRLYYTNAGVSPSVLSNWFVGPSIEATAVSFNGRSGAVVPEFGDYTSDLLPITDKSTSTGYKFVVDNGLLYIENLESNDRIQVAYQDVVSDINSRLVTLDDKVNNQANGISKQVSKNTELIEVLDEVVNMQTSGLVDRVTALEEGGSSKDFTADINALKQKNIEQDVLINTVDSKVDSTASNVVVLGARVDQLEDKTTSQQTRILAAESSLLSKANLVDGKVPYEQLPEFPVGRKVNVTNKAARLALPIYTDLTIAYESDTGDAWGLDANDDPAIDSNWSKLGNSQGIGVASFNGRTGNIGPMAGDYDATKITETVAKRFVSESQINTWNDKETTVGSQVKATAVKTYADETFIPNSKIGVSGGVAKLGDDGKFLAENLPVDNSVWRNVLAERTYNSYRANNTGKAMEVYLRGANNTNINRVIIVNMRQGAGFPTFIFRSAVNTAEGGRSPQITVKVPNGWQYAAQIAGGTPNNKDGFEAWYEFS